MSSRVAWTLRLVRILGNWPINQIDTLWMEDFREQLGIPEGVYPPGTYSELGAKNCVYFSPEELLSWLRDESYLTWEELALVNAKLLMETVE